MVMRVSIIGAGRTRNGIGEYIGKYFHANGAEVTSVLGTTEQTSQGATIALRKYGIVSAPYTNFHRMVERERPEAVVIASPSSTHYVYLVKCIEMGLNIFCEKPFIWQQPAELGTAAQEILQKADEKKVTVAMNSQWPFALDVYEAMCGKIEVKETNRFFMRMSPYSPGREMIPESVPHPLSLLYCSLGEGDIREVGVESPGEREMLLRFQYVSKTGACDVTLTLVSQKEQPRDFRFGFNDKIVRRRIDLKNYDICLHYEGKDIKIVDPLALSVKNFIEAVREKREPLIGSSHILNTINLLKKIDEGYEAGEKKALWKS